MRLLVIYRQNSDHRLKVEEFLRELKNQYPEIKLEILDSDSREGMAEASLYDMLSYPAVLALRDDGSVLQSWAGVDELPGLGDVAYYSLN